MNQLIKGDDKMRKRVKKSLQIFMVILLVVLVTPRLGLAKSTVDIKGYLEEGHSKEDIQKMDPQFSVSNVISVSDLNEYNKESKLVVEAPGKITLKDSPFLLVISRLYGDTRDEYEFYYNTFDTVDSISLSEPGIYEVLFRYEALAGSAYAHIEVVDRDGAGDKDRGPVGKLSNARVFVDDQYVELKGYNIQDNNYFKLRDLAQAFSSSEKKFDVRWNEEKKSIELASGEGYTSVDEKIEKTLSIYNPASPNKSKIYKDGDEVQLVSYTIEGNNYFKLRDITKLFNIGLRWDEAEGAIEMNSSLGYDPEK